MRPVLSDAAEDGYIPTNPIISQRQKRNRTGNSMSVDVDVLDWAQKDSFEAKLAEYEAVGKVTPPYAALFHIMLKAGLRPGEALALKPGDLDFIRKRLRVDRSLSAVDVATGKTGSGKREKERRYFIKSTKTGEQRWVDLSSALTMKLETYLTWLKAEAAGRGVIAEYLFPSETAWLTEQSGRKEWAAWIDERNVARALDRILADAGLPHFTPYDLRHTYASLLLSSGVPLPYVSQQLGHTKPMITLKYYTRWIPTGDGNLTSVLDGHNSAAANTVITPAQVARATDSVRAVRA